MSQPMMNNADIASFEADIARSQITLTSMQQLIEKFAAYNAANGLK